MNTTLRREQYVSIIKSDGNAYTLGAVTYYGLEQDEPTERGEFDESFNNREAVVIHLAIESTKALVTNNAILTDDQGDDVRVISARNKPRDGYQILTCEAVR